MHKAALVGGGLVAFLVSAGLIYFVVVRYLGEPLGQLYRTLSQLVGLAPQDWVWASIIALTVLIGLRNFSSQRKSTESVDSNAEGQAESLESWLRLLQERVRGTYFGWRLANRLAELESQIDDHPDHQPAHQIQEYLKMGRDRRTIGDPETRLSSYPDVKTVITYLERRIEADDGS
ncbi:MAG: hypothetical protein V3U32_01175 [Anaerolineales bacterium]